MTREEILAMEPGRGLDALVAKYVRFPRHTHPIEEIKEWCSKYSTDISAAWEVEEQIHKKRLNVEYCSALKQVVAAKGEYVGLFDYIHATPEQRCKAALLAVLGEDEAK